MGHKVNEKAPVTPKVYRGLCYFKKNQARPNEALI